MRRQPLWCVATILMLGIVLSCGVTPASAQVFALGEWGGDIIGQVQYTRSETQTGNTKPFTFKNLFAMERLRIGNTGAYILDPDLFTISLEGTVGLAQERQRSDTFDFDRNATLWGYNVIASVLADKPTSLMIYANRNELFVSRELAGEERTINEGRGAVLTANTLYIPSTLTFRQDLRDYRTVIGGLVTLRSDKRNTLTYRGLRGWIDSEIDIQYEYVDYKDDIFPSLDYQSHEGSVHYNLDFGTELNRNWDSRFHAISRAGLAPVTVYDVSSRLRIEHTERLKTSYWYAFVATESQGLSTTSHTAGFNLQHQLYNNLTTTFDINGSHLSLVGGEKDILHTALDLSYTKALFWEGHLNIGGGASFDYENGRFAAAQAVILQEPHTASTPFALPIPLNNPLVDTSSVVVTKVATGPLPVGCLPPGPPPTVLVLNRDYTLRTTGSLTEIVPIPCSGLIPGLNPGDAIVVDYRITVSPSLEFYSIGRHAQVSLDFPYIRPYFSYERIDQTALSGQITELLLDDRETDIAGLELRYDSDRLHAGALGEATRYRSQRQDYDSVRLAQSLNLTILRDWPEWRISLSASELQQEYKNPDHTTKTLLVAGTSSHTLADNLFMDIFGTARWYKDSLLPTERLIEAGLRVRWFLRQLEIFPELGFADRQRGDTSGRDYRGMLTLTRRF